MIKLKALAAAAAAAVLLSGCTLSDSLPDGDWRLFKGESLSSSDSSIPDSDTVPDSEAPETSEPEITEDDVSMSVASRYYFSRIEEPRLKTAALRIYKALQDHETEVSLLGLSITDTEFADLYDLAVTAEPDIGWADREYSVYSGLTGKITKAEFGYTLDEAGVDNSVDKLHLAAEQLVKEAESLDDFGKVLYFHDHIINNCDYDMSNENAWSAYGCLVEGRAVCEGYSKAMLLLCDIAGIECLTVAGNAVDDGEPHMWNKIRMDGEWYNLDLTWDDPDEADSSNDQGYVHYEYFGQTDNIFSIDHNYEETLFLKYPEADGSDDNYFIRSGLLIDDPAEADSLFFRAACDALVNGSTAVQLMCSDSEVFNAVYEHEFGGEEGMENIFYILDEIAAAGMPINTSTYRFISDQNHNILILLMDVF